MSGSELSYVLDTFFALFAIVMGGNIYPLIVNISWGR